jgi:hypothetical protein
MLKVEQDREISRKTGPIRSITFQSWRGFRCGGNARNFSGYRPLVIPKDWPIGRKAPYASAAREALEEAGAVGKVGRVPLGTYTYEQRLGNGGS